MTKIVVYVNLLPACSPLPLPDFVTKSELGQILKEEYKKQVDNLPKCIRKITLDEIFYNYATNKKNKPEWLHTNEYSKKWNALSESERLQLHLNRFDEGLGYRFSIISD